MIREDRVITRLIHYLCLMLDDIDEKIDKKAVIRIADLVELQEKAKLLADRAMQLQKDQDSNLKSYEPQDTGHEDKTYSWEEVKASIKARWKDSKDN